MKKITFISVLIGVFSMIISCDIHSSRRTEADFTIINNTNVPVRMLFINQNPDIDSGDREELLYPEDIYEGFTIESSIRGLFDDPEVSVINAFPRDSIVLVFNSERVTSYGLIAEGNNTPIYSAPVNRNILRSGNYEEVSEENFIYTITQEDFDNATPCDGPCE